MRTFDIIGSVLLAGWVIFAGAYVWQHEAEPKTTSVQQSDEGVEMKEGERWMLLRRKGNDIGYIRRVTTRLADGWLLEYEVLVLLEVAGRTYGVQADFDARLDTEGVITGFTAKGHIGGESVKATGDVSDSTVSATLNLGDQTKQHSVELDEPPRLTASRLPAIAKDESLEPGDRIRQSVFAPARFGMQSVVLEVVGYRTINLITDSARALYLRQHVAGEEYDIYIDEQGSILLREFPLRIYGLYTEPDFASSRAATLRKRFDEADEIPSGALKKAGKMLNVVGGEATGSSLLPSGPMEVLGELGASGSDAQQPPATDRDAGTSDASNPPDTAHGETQQ